MKTTTTIRLRNKITGLYYVQGKNFTGTESEATLIERNSPTHAVIRYTYTMPKMENNIEEVETVSAKKFIVYHQLGYGSHGSIKFLERMNGDIAIWTEDINRAMQVSQIGAKRIANKIGGVYRMRVGCPKWYDNKGEAIA